MCVAIWRCVGRFGAIQFIHFLLINEHSSPCHFDTVAHSDTWLKSRFVRYNNLLFLGVNIFLNWLFVFGGPLRGVGWEGFGFVGAAVSLSVSRSLQPLAYWLYIHARNHSMYNRARSKAGEKVSKPPFGKSGRSLRRILPEYIFFTNEVHI